MKHLPNLLTSARILLVPCFLVASMERHYLLAFVIFVTAAVTDILDGLLARWLNVRSRLGSILDPLADKMLMVCGFLYYTFAHDLPVAGIPGWLTFAVFIRDFLIVFVVYLLYTRIHIKHISPSVAGKASTLLQAFTLGTVIAMNAFLPRWAPAAAVLFRVSLLITLYSGWDYMRRISHLLRDAEA